MRATKDAFIYGELERAVTAGSGMCSITSATITRY